MVTYMEYSHGHGTRSLLCSTRLVQEIQHGSETLNASQIARLNLNHQMGNADIREGAQTLGHLFWGTGNAVLIGSLCLSGSQYVNERTSGQRQGRWVTSDPVTGLHH